MGYATTCEERKHFTAMFCQSFLVTKDFLHNSLLSPSHAKFYLYSDNILRIGGIAHFVCIKSCVVALLDHR